MVFFPVGGGGGGGGGGDCPMLALSQSSQTTCDGIIQIVLFLLEMGKKLHHPQQAQVQFLTSCFGHVSI